MLLRRSSLWRAQRVLGDSIKRGRCAACGRGRQLSSGTEGAREVPEGVRSKLGADLHLRPGHPLQIIKRTIEMHFEQEARSSGSEPFMFFDSLPPQVSLIRSRALSFSLSLFLAPSPSLSLSLAPSLPHDHAAPGQR